MWTNVKQSPIKCVFLILVRNNMEQQDKYYTPSIEEFHVGFEYERKTSFGWVKSIFIEPLFNNSKIGQGSGNDKKEWFSFERRVKYLDKEDIESLGFINIKEYSGSLNFQKIIDDYLFYEIDLDLGDNITTIEKYYSQNADGICNCYTLFKGIIKNKSELKFILKSIGVLEEKIKSN
jgi:hypothetical protein